MRSPVQALWTLYVLLSSFFTVARAFKNISASAITLSPGGFADLGWFSCDADQRSHIIQSTTTLGATASTSFRGTAVYLLALVDLDRGVLQVTVDNEPPVDVTGSFGTRECRFIFSRQNLPNGKHTISAKVKAAGPGGFTKFELASFVYTAPEQADNAALQTAATPSATSPTSRPSSNINAAANSTPALSGASIGGIVAGCIGIIALAAAIIFYYLHRQRLKRLMEEDRRSDMAPEFNSSPKASLTTNMAINNQSAAFGHAGNPFNTEIVPSAGRMTPSNMVSYAPPTPPQPAVTNGPYPFMSQYGDVYSGRRI